MLPGKLFYAFEHDVFPLCHCNLKESHRHKLGLSPCVALTDSFDAEASVLSKQCSENMIPKRRGNTVVSVRESMMVVVMLQQERR